MNPPSRAGKPALCLNPHPRPWPTSVLYTPCPCWGLYLLRVTWLLAQELQTPAHMHKDQEWPHQASLWLVQSRHKCTGLLPQDVTG